MQAVLRGGRGCTLCWWPKWVRCKSLPSSTGFEGIKGLWTAPEVCHWERLGEAIGEGAAGIVVEVPGLKESWRKNEVLHHKENPGEAIDGSAAWKQQQTPAL